MKKAILNKYALNGYTVHSNLPIGAPIPWFSDILPVGFLNCDHTKIKKSDYPELWDRLKNVPMCQSEETDYFFTPDLREVSLVGIGENGTLDISAHDIYELGQFKDEENGFNAKVIIKDGASGVASKGNGDLLNSENVRYNDETWQNQNCSPLLALTGTYGSNINRVLEIGSNEKHTHGKQVGVRWIIKATQYATVEQNAIDDTKFTTGNVLSAQKTKELTEENYSTEERVIGKWIDGKPLYQKTFYIESGLSNGMTIATMPNIKIKKIYGTSKYNNGDYYPFPYMNAPYSECWVRYVSNGNITLVLNESFSDLSFTIEYTKTTD